MAENSISYGMGLSDQMINQMLQSDDPSIVAQAQNYVNQSQTQQEEKPSLLKRIGNFFISPAASAEVDINSNQNTLSEDQLNYLLQSSYLPSDTGFQIGQFGPNQNYLGKGMQGLESLGIGPNLNYLGDGPMTGSIGVGPNQNYLGKGMQIGSIGQPRYDSGTQTIFPSNMSPALSDLGGITPSYGVANEADVEQVDSLTGEKKSSGIVDLLSFFVPGLNFLKNFEGTSYQQFDPRATVKDGIYSLGAFNQPANMVNDFYDPITRTNRFDRASAKYKKTGSIKDLFASSRTGTEFFKKLKERNAPQQTTQDTRDIQTKIDTGRYRRTAADNVIDRGRGENNIASRAPKGPTGAKRGIDAKNKSSIDPAVGRRG